MHTALMFSSCTGEWEMPAQLFEGLNEEFCSSIFEAHAPFPSAVVIFKGW